MTDGRGNVAQVTQPVSLLAELFLQPSSDWGLVSFYAVTLNLSKGLSKSPQFSVRVSLSLYLGD